MVFATAAALAGTVPLARAEQAPIVGVVSTVGSIHQPHGADVIAGVTDAARRLLGPDLLLLGNQIRIVGIDEDCTRAGAERAARQLVAQKVAVVIGHVCAVAATAAAPIYAAAGLPVIVPGVRHPRLTSPRAGALVFRLAGRSDKLAAEVTALLADDREERRLAIVHDKSAQSSADAEAVDRLVRVRGKPALREAITTGEKSYRPLVERLKAADVGVVFYTSQAIELGIVLSQMREIGLGVPVIGTESLAVPDFDRAAAANASQVRVMLPWPPLATAGRMAGGAGDGSASEGRSPATNVHRLASAALEAWVHAVKSQGGTEPLTVARALQNEAAPTGIGPIRFDANGDAMVPAYVTHVRRENGWKPLER